MGTDLKQRSAYARRLFELADETVWGATARILYGFLSYLVGGREPATG